MKHLNRLFMTSAFLIVLLLCNAGHGTQEMPWLELNAEGSVTLSPQPEVGKTFEVVFTFRVTDTLSHSRQEPDSAWIRCQNSLIQYVDGDTLWTGYIETGRQYELRCRFRVVSGTRFRMLGGVFARQALGKIEKAITDTGRESDLGFEARRVFRMGSFDLRTEQQRIQSERRQPVVRLKVTDSGVVPTDTVWESLRFQKRPTIKFIKQEAASNSKIEADFSGQTETATRTRIRLVTGLDCVHLDTLHVLYIPEREYRFFHESLSSEDSVEVTLIAGNASFIRTGPHHGRFKLGPGSEQGTFRVMIGSVEKTIIVKDVEW